MNDHEREREVMNLERQASLALAYETWAGKLAEQLEEQWAVLEGLGGGCQLEVATNEGMALAQRFGGWKAGDDSLLPEEPEPARLDDGLQEVVRDAVVTTLREHLVGQVLTIGLKSDD